MINIDVAATAFYESGPLSEIVAKILNRRSVDELRRGIPPRDLNKLERILKKVRLYSTHRGERRFKHTLHRFTPESADNTFFTTEDGGKVSVSKYFLQKYNKRLNYPFLPCVAVKDTVFLPMEVLEIIPGQRFNHKLNEKQTADMIKFTCQKPFQRANKIKQGLPLLEYQNPYMKDFNMEVSNDMAMINARVLSLPKISYNPSSQEALVTPTGGIWTLRGKKLLKGATLSSWSVVNFAGNVPKPALDRFFREIVSGFIDKGMNVTNRTPIMINADPQGNIETILKDAGSKAFKATKLAPQVIFCVVNNVNTALYPEIKRVSDTVIGVPTQCLQSKHIADANKQYCANVSLKVNVKLGGTNTCLPNGQIPFISQKPTIIFGADVTHPSPGDFARPSIAALTASMDAQASRYASTIRVQANRTEVIADLANMVKEMLRAFYSACGQKPQRMIFYRDGVSEGQFRQVMDEEVKAIKLACSTLEKSYDPALSFVAVQKRHHARFFPVDIKDADKTGNCMPGTVVDSDICHPTEFDFYLLSHPGLQGTCRPTHYHVLHDENNFSADSLQELTYRLCYTYARCTRAVSIVPAVYYADIIAARARYHRRGENWSDNAGTTAVTDPETMMSSFSPVHPQLQKIMYFM
jgi:eukaryotic translation initiation factor 2C